MAVSLPTFISPYRLAGWLLLLIGLAGCSLTPPQGITPVSPFDVNRYTGKWYEIARLDHRFERGLTDNNATYSVQADGSVEVINRGYDTEDRQWKQVTGKALFQGSSNTASLKVSFFGPFYGAYHVAALDEPGYRWSLVTGPNRDYLWILARDKHLPEALKQDIVQRARKMGFDTDKLIWTPQQRDDS